MDHAPDPEGEMELHPSLTEPCDSAVLDVMLPPLDGLPLIGRLPAAAKRPRLKSNVTQISFGNLWLWLFITCERWQVNETDGRIH